MVKSPSRRWRAAALAGCLACLSVAAWTPAHAGTVRINGSGVALDMMKPIVEAYTKLHPEERIEMEKPLGSSGALKALLAGAMDLVLSSKPLSEEQVRQGAVAREYGRMPLAIVVERSVPKADISTRELEEIYGGRLTAWPDGERVRVVLRPESDADTSILKGLSPALGRAIDEARARPGMLIAVTDPESNEAIARTAGAIGASGLPGVVVGARPLKVLSLNGVQPTVQALAAGAYPLAKDVRFVTRRGAPAAVERVIAFAFGREGRAIAERTGVLVTAGTPPGR
ncbi:MAG TPA: substrate-binding domain-containing protein [bacterium]